MIKRDNQGRITYLDDEENPKDCHSICNHCRRDMPTWDVVCWYCSRTFCYKCVTAIGKRWICVDCQ